MIVYTTPWCGYCHSLKAGLERAGIPFEEVDIEQRPDAETVVRRVNGGNATVPTVVFPDGSAATNPSVSQVRARLAPASSALAG